MVAAGAYLRVIRTALGITQEDAAEELGAERKTIGTWEAGRNTPDAETLACYIDLVHGSAVHVHELLIDKKATAEDGRDMARVWLHSGNIAASPQSTTDEQVVMHAVSVLIQLTNTQRLRLIAYLLGRDRGDA